MKYLLSSYLVTNFLKYLETQKERSSWYFHPVSLYPLQCYLCCELSKLKSNDKCNMAVLKTLDATLMITLQDTLYIARYKDSRMAWPLVSGSRIMSLSNNCFTRNQIGLQNLKTLFLATRPSLTLIYFRFGWKSGYLCPCLVFHLDIISRVPRLIRCSGSSIWPGALIFEIWAITTNVLLSIYRIRHRPALEDKNEQGKSLIRHLLGSC